MILSQLQAFVSDHDEHSLSFESQEYIECVSCGETFTLPDGSGVDMLERAGRGEVVFIEVPSGIANGHVTYTIDLEEGTVQL